MCFVVCFLSALVLTNCPSLHTPPHEIVSRGTEAVISYLKKLSGGHTENWMTKLMLVGLGGAGKTRYCWARWSWKNKVLLG